MLKGFINTFFRRISLYLLQLKLGIRGKNINENFLLLRSYQRQGVKFLMESESALLADEMGLGKTVQTAVAIEGLINSKEGSRILIICPSSLCYNWEVELRRWSPNVATRRVRGSNNDRKAHFSLPFKVWIASYEQIRIDIDFLQREEDYDVVILDEAQRIKNQNSSVALACRQLPRKRAWALTGTPIENRIDDLLSIFAFLKPGLLNVALSRNKIHLRMGPHFLRRCKNEVLSELPPMVIQNLLLEMAQAQQEAYYEEWSGAHDRMHQMHGNLTSMDVLAQITRLKLICNFEPKFDESCKLKALESILEGLEGEADKILVFSQYVNTLFKIRDKLNNISVDCFHGGLSAEQKEGVISSFEKTKGPKVLLVSLKAGGVGLNLSTASKVILFDRWWNPAVENQAIQRAHRYGRKNSLQVIKFLVVNTVEERIEQILKEKEEIFTSFVDNATIAKISPFSQEDLLRILGFGSLES